MDHKPPTRPASIVLFGLGAASIGVTFTLVGLGLLPPPGAQHAPGWIVVCAGLAFLLGGIGTVAQGFGRANESGELPPAAPRWTRAVQHLAALAVVFCLAAIGTWVALAGEADQFTMTSSFTAERSANLNVARTAFGLGALVTWLYV